MDVNGTTCIETEVLIDIEVSCIPILCMLPSYYSINDGSLLLPS